MSYTNKLSTGKIPKDLLKRLVFTFLGTPSDRVLKGPKIGEDAALIDLGDKVLVAKANPITGAENRIGWLAAHINANDVAARGAVPLWYMSIILLPEGSDEGLLETIIQEQHEACCELGVSVIGGHTEVAPGLSRPIVSGFMLGEASKDQYVTTDGAKIGDKIILTKGVGLEGTGIFASDLKDKLTELPETLLNEAVKLLNQISVVPEALEAIRIGGINSIHTPTEGGILNGLIEISEAAETGFRIFRDQLLIREETRQICDMLDVDPLKLISSGSLLLVSEPSYSEKIVEALAKINIPSTIIGEITSDSYVIVEKDGSETVVESVEQDELFRVLEELN